MIVCQPSPPLKLLPSLSPPQVFTRYGKCYMFNAAEEGKTLRTTMKGGTGNGLEIMLDIQQDEYLPVWGDTGRQTTRGRSRPHTSRLLLLFLTLWQVFAFQKHPKRRDAASK